MLKLHQLFFINFAIILIVTSIVAGTVLFFNLKSHQIDSIEGELTRHINLIEIGLEDGPVNFSSLAKKFYENNEIRVTIISNSGKVLAESQKDPAKMNNHNRREEVILARKNQFGSSTRYSETIKKEFMYVAKKVSYQDSFIIIRLSVSLDNLQEKTFDFWLKITLFVVIAIFTTLILSLFLNKKISKEIKSLIEDARDFSVKNYPNGQKRFFIHEFSIIYNTLFKSGKRLKKVDKKKRKYDAKIRMKNRQQRDMLSAMGHEFKNPIAIIKGYSDTLIDDGQINADLRKRFLEKIQKSATKLDYMVDKFSLAIRLETDNLRVEKTKFNIKEMVVDIVDSLNENYPDRTIHINIVDNKVFADKALLEIAVKNLIENALKYSQEDIEILLDGDNIEVRDRGIGILEADIEDITKKFYRVSNLSWNNSMGLGLFIVSYILKLHNTKLEIKSEKDVGSTFFFDINPLIG